MHESLLVKNQLIVVQLTSTSSKIKDELIQKVPLKEIKQFLLDDPELTNEERFELYYQEHRRVQDEKNGNKEFNKMLKDLKIKPYNKGKS